MNIEVRAATESEISAIVRLMRDFAEYENLGEYCTVTEERLASVIFGEHAFVECLTAYSGDKLVAYALFYPSFASFRGQRGFYLEDIFISHEHRGIGIGETMLKQIARIAKIRGFERIDFQVLEWNSPAISFYEKLGAVRNDDERHFKFSDDVFRYLADSEPA